MSEQKTPIKWKDIPSYGNLMTAEAFAVDVMNGCLIDYDGYGRWATSDKMSDVVISPSKLKKPPKWATHVVWFNR